VIRPAAIARGALLMAALATYACGREEQAVDSAAAPTTPPPSGTARISGRVTFDGNVPEQAPVSMNADPYCARANEARERSVSLRVGADGALGDVFVYVSKGVDARYPAPDRRAVLDQRACVYAPKVIGLQVGQPLEIRNSDDTLHNVHALAQKSGGFNVGMPHRGMTTVRKFTAPEVLVRIKCDVHPWMAAYAGVVAHPFYAVTAEDGAYALEGLPAGTYTISAVHHDLGGQVRDVTVTDGAAAAADFRFSD
jgi:plastocyanin